MAFDPFTATLEEAQAYEEELLAGKSGVLIRGPVLQACAAHELVERREFYEENPLDGIAVCAIHDLVAPHWLAAAYLRGFRAVANCRVGSWDEAFGSPVPKGRQVAAMRRDRLRRPAIWNLVIDFTQRFPEEPLERLWEAFDVAHAGGTQESLETAAEFAESAREMGCGSTVAQRLYAEACRQMGFGAADVRQRMGWPPIVPAKFRKAAGRRLRGKG
jgi:hypothetical protein